MGKRQQATLTAFLAAAIGASAMILSNHAGLIGSAGAQSDDEKKKKGKEPRKDEQQKPTPSRPQPSAKPEFKGPPPTVTPKVTAPPPSRPLPQVDKPPPKPFQQPTQQFQQPPQGPKPFQPKPLASPPPDPKPEVKKEGVKRFPPPGQPGPQAFPPPKDTSPSFQKPFQPKPLASPPPDSKPEPKQEGFKRLPPPGQPGQQALPPKETLPPKGPPPSFQKPLPSIAKPPPSGPSGPATVQPLSPRPTFGQPAPKRLDEVQKGRLERFENDGKRKVIVEGNRFIVKEANKTIIRHDETERFLRFGAKSDRRPDGTVETVIVRPGGVRVITVVDANGRLLRRYRRDRSGREWNIVDNRRLYRNVAIGIGIGAIIALNLRPPRVTIPRDRYIVDYDRASDDDLYDTLYAPPIERLERPYSLDEIRYNYELRARVRSIDLDSITFESGSWEVTPDQYGRLERMARAILRILRDNPDAAILIEGHTDKVGDEEYNLSLGDRRAQEVAEVLTDTFNVPPENLVTQGYGEQYPKIDTEGPEPRNRRVVFRNVTGLMER